MRLSPPPPPCPSAVPCLLRQLANLGDVFKSTEPLRLTEEDTEYSIFCVKHVFESHLVLQVRPATVNRTYTAAAVISCLLLHARCLYVSS